MKFYAITSKIAKPFSNRDKDLIVQVRCWRHWNAGCSPWQAAVSPCGHTRPGSPILTKCLDCES